MKYGRHGLDPKMVRAVRNLDIAFMHAFMTKERGRPFEAAQSSVNGKMYSADESALLAAHKLRTRIGSKKERKASIAWLQKEGLNGLFEESLQGAQWDQ